MKTAPFRVQGRAFTIAAEGIGGGTGDDPYDAIDYLLDWLEEKTATQIAVFHTVLAATQHEPTGAFSFVEVDEIRAAQAAALCFALRLNGSSESHASVTLHAINPE